VELFVAAVEALKKKERGAQNKMKMSLAPKQWCISEFQPHPARPRIEC
jgi:hypothetical protein